MLSPIKKITMKTKFHANSFTYKKDEEGELDLEQTEGVYDPYLDDSSQKYLQPITQERSLSLDPLLIMEEAFSEM